MRLEPIPIALSLSLSRKRLRRVAIGASYIAVIAALFYNSIFFRFYRDAAKGYVEYQKTLAILAKLGGESDWRVTPRPDATHRDVRIVVIGESARKDYFSLYGYPRETTPFLDGANGLFIDGFTAASYTTISSLVPALTARKEGKFDFPNNAVSLAKAAGYDAYWLSNQGFQGDYDTTISYFARQAKSAVFLNFNGYEDSKDDFDLVDRLEVLLKDKGAKPKLIFIHTIGSHGDPCERLFDFPINFKTARGKRFDCYLASIEKTDKLLETIVNRLKSRGLSYSLIYFSDHGVRHRGDDGDISFGHGSVRQSYEVPFVVLDSNATKREFVKRSIGGAHFLDLFAAWIGVNTNHTDPRYTLRDYPEDKNTTIDANAGKLENDPAKY